MIIDFACLFDIRGVEKERWINTWIENGNCSKKDLEL
jgi:hypothetical protein